MSYQCEVFEMPSQPAVAVRTITTFHKLPRTIADAFSSLRRYLHDEGMTATGPMYVKYEGGPAHDFPVEIGVPVTLSTVIGPGFTAAQLPGGRAASVLHRGHYSDLPHAYRALEKWVSTESLAVTGDAYELYLNDGEHTPPAAWLTRVAMPLA